MEGRRVALLLVAGAAALVALALHAAAAPFDPTLTANATFPVEPFTPFVDAPGFPGVSEVEVRFPMRVDLSVPAGHVATGPTRVALAATEQPFWLDVRFEPEGLTFPTGTGPVTQATTYTQTVDVVAYATRVAPSATQGNVELTATALRAERGDLPMATAPTQGLVIARPYTLFKAEVADPMLRVERYGSVNVTVAVSNSGNALVAAVVQVAHADPGLDVRVVSPIPVVFRPNPLDFEPVEVGHVPVEIRHRSGAGGEVLLLVTTALPEDGWLVQDRAVRLHVDVGEPAGPSGTLPLLALVGVAAAVFLVRRT